MYYSERAGNSSSTRCPGHLDTEETSLTPQIESIFSVTQLLTVFYWGSLSDRIGRKPVLIMGSLGCFVSAVGFGLSTSFWMMAVTRGFAGLMNGNVAVLKCVM